jgi:hypothetical protein
MQLITTSIQAIKASRPSLPFLADIEHRVSNKSSESLKERERYTRAHWRGCCQLIT